MEYICTICRQPVPQENVDRDQGLAFCATCDQRLPLNQLIEKEIERVPAPLATKALFTRDAERLAIVVPKSGFRGAGCFLTFFGLFWNGIVWTIVIVNFTQLLSNKGQSIVSAVNIGALVFLIPFMLIGMLVIAGALYCIFSDVALVMDKNEVLIEHRMFGWSWKRHYPLESITGVALEVAYTMNNRKVYGVGIHLKDKRIPLTFGSSLPEDEKRWLVGELNAFRREQRG